MSVTPKNFSPQLVEKVVVEVEVECFILNNRLLPHSVPRKDIEYISEFIQTHHQQLMLCF